MNNQTLPKSEDRNLNRSLEITMKYMRTVYLRKSPKKNSDNFLLEYLAPMSSNEDTSGDTFLANMINLEKDSRAYRHGFLVVACAYFTQALRARDRNEIETSWSYLCDARYFCGVAMADTTMDQIADNIGKATRKITAKNAGAARTIKYDKVKEKFFELVIGKCPPGNGWQTKKQAIYELSEEVFTFAESVKTPLSRDQFERTAYEWLKLMPNQARYFPDSKGKFDKKNETTG
ncbi:hypothetical protein [Undibacterium sp. JH2W]|uniref:hypothetical protein n=1 Tax=Undibacterium sp. JH2W TaxID=3413037 RepID=UPI003BF4D1E5